MDFGNSQNIEIEILIDNTLHGKIYIGKSRKLNRAIITSANFTSNGLRTNNEWGICIDDQDQILEIESDLRRNITLEPISRKRIKQFIEIISKNPRRIVSEVNSLNLI